jgi:hypothetical protein
MKKIIEVYPEVFKTSEMIALKKALNEYPKGSDVLIDYQIKASKSLADSILNRVSPIASILLGLIAKEKKYVKGKENKSSPTVIELICDYFIENNDLNNTVSPTQLYLGPIKIELEKDSLHFVGEECDIPILGLHLELVDKSNLDFFVLQVTDTNNHFINA